MGVPIPLLSQAYKGKSHSSSVERRVNCYAEIDQGKKTVARIVGTPGMASFGSLGAPPFRGLWQHDTYLYGVAGASFVRLGNDGSYTVIDTIASGSGRIYMDDNGVQYGKQIMIIDNQGNGYIYNTTTLTLTAISDPDFPGASSLTFCGGYFVITEPNSGRYWVSSLYDGLTWAGLDYKTAEEQSDDLVRVYDRAGQLLCFGENTLEFHGQTGRGFPFQRLQGATQNIGLAAAGSVVDVGNTVAFLGKNKTGAIRMYLLNGYSPEPISNGDIEEQFRGLISTGDCEAFSYSIDDHEFIELNFPSDGKSFLCDLSTRLWSELESDGGRHWAQYYAAYNGQHIVSDYRNGNLYRLDPDVYTDNATRIRRELVLPYVHSDDRYFFPSRVEIDLETGTAGVNDTEPMMLMEHTDNGKEWSFTRRASMGKYGEHGKRLYWRMNRRHRTRSYRFSTDDDVRFWVNGVYLRGELGD